MEVKSAFNSAVTGIQRGLQGLDRNSSEVAAASDGSGDSITQPLVESRINKLQVEASAQMVKTVDDALGSLLDELA